jgi:predicted phosphoadenosine phosphosulfate sulfurtransferase
MLGKRRLGIDVLTAAERRIALAFDRFARLYVSFSAGKDSTVLLHLVAREARRRQRRIGMLLIDLEGQYSLTIEHARACFDDYADIADRYWVALPLNLRNAVSQFEPQWVCWDPDRKADWIRQPPEGSITDEAALPFFRRGMEFEEFAPAFGHWYSQGQPTCCFVGIRADESLNRYRTICSGMKSTFDGLQWTTWCGQSLYNAYPIYDWRTEDIWTFHARTGLRHNELYDRMQMAGLSIHQQRICQPYGDDQRKGLWLFHVIEPETWARIVARVNGANHGALYAQERGDILGRIKITRPAGHTWQSFAMLLLQSMPAHTAEHYRNKIAVFLHWWQNRGYAGGIPDEADAKMEADKTVPSWRRICKTLLRNDYWCKGLSFSQHQSAAYERYRKIMQKRRLQWRLPI